MKKKSLILKIAVAMLVFGGFGVVSNFANSTSVYAMDASDGSAFAFDKLQPDKVGSFEIITSKPSVDDVKSTDLNLEQQEKKNKIDSANETSEKPDRTSKDTFPRLRSKEELDAELNAAQKKWNESPKFRKEALKKIDWLNKHMFTVIKSEEEFDAVFNKWKESPKFKNETELGKKMADKFENKVRSFLYCVAGDKYEYCRLFDPERIGEEPLPGRTKEDLEESRSVFKKVYHDELIKDFDQVNDYLKSEYETACRYGRRLKNEKGALDLFKADLIWFQCQLIDCLHQFKNGDKFYYATKLNVDEKDRSIFWNFAFDKDVLERIINFAEICDKAFGEYSLFRINFKHQPEEVLKAIESNI